MFPPKRRGYDLKAASMVASAKQVKTPQAPKAGETLTL